MVLNKEFLEKYLDKKPHIKKQKLLENTHIQNNQYLFVINDEKDCFIKNNEITSYLNIQLDGLDSAFSNRKINIKCIRIKPDFSFLELDISNETYLRIKKYSIYAYEGDWSFSLKLEYTRILFYETLDYVRCTSTGKYFKCKISETGFAGLDYAFKEPLFLDLPLFQLVKDITEEQGYLDKHGFISRTTVTYDDLLKAQKEEKTRNQLLLTKYKRLSPLANQINMNKYKIYEIYALMKLKPRLTDTEFKRVTQWYVQNKSQVLRKVTDEEYQIKDLFDAKHLYINYLSARFNRKKDYDDDEYIIISDVLDMAKNIAKKVECPMKTWKSFINYHNELAIKERNKMIKKNLGTTSIVLPEKWNPLVTKLKTLKQVDVLDTVNKLIVEGNQMHHCVASYAKRVQKGQCLIFSIVIEGTRHTVEVTARGRKNIKYRVNQIQRKYNMKPNQKAVKEIKELIECT